MGRVSFEVHPVGKITEHEQKLLDVCLGDLKKNIEKGIKFAKMPFRLYLAKAALFSQ